MVPDRQQIHRAGRSIVMRVARDAEDAVASRVWFWTRPLCVADIAAVQLVTVYRDQGWNPSRRTGLWQSRFEWGVFSEGIPAAEETAYTGNERARSTRGIWHK
ncbi:hypothetical protein K438DRAFT_1772929 [Mycena galopus ATCC 62051]|nr:hypothetical protein K438DRAFT_1772929 [Mycena galopus ATCC 62051]